MNNKTAKTLGRRATGSLHSLSRKESKALKRKANKVVRYNQNGYNGDNLIVDDWGVTTEMGK